MPQNGSMHREIIYLYIRINCRSVNDEPQSYNSKWTNLRNIRSLPTTLQKRKNVSSTVSIVWRSRLYKIKKICIYLTRLPFILIIFKSLCLQVWLLVKICFQSFADMIRTKKNVRETETHVPNWGLGRAGSSCLSSHTKMTRGWKQ